MDKEEKKIGKSWRKEREEREKKKTVKVVKTGKDSNEVKVASKPIPANQISETISSNVKDTKKVEEIEKEDKKEVPKEEDKKIEKNKEIEAAQQRAKREDEEREKAQKLEEDRNALLKYIQEAEDRLQRKADIRSKNVQATKDRPELNTALLDSSLKKNTVFIKKLKNLRESQLELLEKDLMSLNLSKYISEVAAAIVEAKLKMADIQAAIHICSLLHQRYHDFAPFLLQNWQKILNIKKDEKISNMSKLRVDLRFYAELISAGIFAPKEGLPLLGNILTTLVTTDKEQHQNVAVLITFCRHCGEDYMGLLSRKIRILSEQFQMAVPKSDFLPTERQKNVRNLLKDYYNSLTKHLHTQYKELQKVEQQNRRIMQTRGELPTDRKDLVDSLTETLDKLTTNATQMAELFDEDLPELPQQKAQAEEGGMVEPSVVEGEVTEGSNISLWEDDDTKAFYTNLPELKALLPSILYSDSEKPSSQTKGSDNVKDAKDTSDSQLEPDDMEDLSAIEEIEEEEVMPPELPAEDEQDDSSVSSGVSSTKILLEGFLNSLPNCISRDLMDSAAMEFCVKLNTKPCRKKLVRALFLVPRTRLDLLPFYSRLTATLQPLMPDVATDLGNMLKQDFKYQVKKKDQINIESKIKVVRFIGELVKFGVFPRSEALICLRMLLQDFNHHHIEMACNLLETCGRFLYKNPDSHHRTKVFLEQMLRKKTVKAFDARYNTMIENAYFYVNPPEEGPESAKIERPPMHQYIRRLLYHNLTKSNTEKILKQMRKLHWEDKDIANYAVRCLTAVWNAKYYNIRCIANLLAGLISHYDWVGPAVVDGVLEDIKIGMEVNHPKFNQRRVAAVKYLGELYNYRIIESTLIFKVLYLFITFGVSRDPEIASDYDPPDHVFRIRLVTTLLDTCGQFFISGSSKRKLDCFLTYFQDYYLYKKSLWPDDSDFPCHIDHLVKDTIQTVRPKLKLFTTLQEAQDAVIALNQQFLSKAIEQVPALKKLINANEDNNTGDNNTLPPIPEDESAEGDDLLLEDDDDDEGREGGGDESGKEGDEEGDGEWSEIKGESLTPSQHSQSSRLPLNDELTQDDEERTNSAMRDGIDDEHVEVSLNHVTCQEDDDFMTAFDKMIADSVIERTREIPRPNTSSISVPVQRKSSAKKTYEQIITEELEEEAKPMVNFVLMTRSGNKQQFTNVEMPVDSELVTKLRNREEAEREERERVKRMTLEINERQEEEEAQELLQQAQRPAVSNCNRDRRSKYQHPKGAPDADLIFGPKRTR